MIRVVIGAVAGAVAMFIIGFILWGLLGSIAVGDVGDAEAAEIQSVLASNLDAEGARTVIVPSDSGSVQQRMYIDGPIALIHYNPNGQDVGPSAPTMLGGFIHMLVSALLLGGALYGLSGHVRGFAERFKVVVIFSFAASCFMHLGMPIWWHQDWTFHIYAFFADALSFIVAGGIIARWFLPGDIASEDRLGADRE